MAPQSGGVKIKNVVTFGSLFVNVENIFRILCHLKNKVTNEQNAKHVYIEQQIHSPNFTLTRASGHLNFLQKPAKRLEVFKGSDRSNLTLLIPLASFLKVFKPTQIT